MKKFLTPIVMAAGLLLAGAAQAASISLEPIARPLDPAIERLRSSRASIFEIRETTIADAKGLLNADGSTWRVRQVQAPVCESPKSKEKVSKKICLEMKADCRKAEVFAKAYAIHAACSALYTQTTVLLTNDAPPRKGLSKAKTASSKEAKKSTPKPKQ